MIPRVRLKYVQGLAAVHEDLHLPREVDLTTDGEYFVVSSAASGRPLLKLPFDAVEDMTIERNAGPTTPENLATGAMTGRERVIVMQLRAARGVPAVCVGVPIVFGPTREEDVGPLLEGVKRLLVPRTPKEMARLARREQHYYALYTAGVLLALLLILAVLVGLFLVFGTPQRDTRAAPAPLAKAGTLSVSV